jgi:Rieske Fe-S protein
VLTRSVTVTATPSSSTSTATTSTTAATAATGATPTATTSTTASIPPASQGPIPALNGTYGLDQTDHQEDINVYEAGNPHDGIYSADKTWIVLSGSCSGGGCTISLRRVLSDDTIEGITVKAPKPAGVYTGQIPGGDGRAKCSGNATVPIRLSIIIRVGGLQNINGQQIASRLAGHIFADYDCPDSGPAHVVATYVGTRQ